MIWDKSYIVLKILIRALGSCTKLCDMLKGIILQNKGYSISHSSVHPLYPLGLFLQNQ